jgi:hypothetical protein
MNSMRIPPHRGHVHRDTFYMNSEIWKEVLCTYTSTKTDYHPRLGTLYEEDDPITIHTPPIVRTWSIEELQDLFTI